MDTEPSWVDLTPEEKLKQRSTSSARPVEVFAPEGCEKPDVTRFISSRQLDVPRINPCQRISEIWFDDSEGWRRAMAEKADSHTRPLWAECDAFPFVEPFKDFVDMFILDGPDSDHLQQWRGRITTR